VSALSERISFQRLPFCSIKKIKVISVKKMAKPRDVSAVKSGVAVWQEPKSSDFVKWGKDFFAYLVTEKSGTNAGLLELIYHLGDDGRQELALCVFNFLRPCVWKDFCRDRRDVKQRAKKELSKARSDLRRARGVYSRLLDFMPEIAICRRLGDTGRLHLSDLLEKEAAFLAAQSRLTRVASPRVCRVNRQELRQPERDSRTQDVALLSTASAKLTRAAKSYRKLLTLTPTAAIGKAFDSFMSSQLAAVLESEEADLRGILGRVDPAFNKKRFGKMDLAILVRLQYLVEIFVLRWRRYLPQNITMILHESDVADLLEAGTNSLGMPDCSALTDAESIGRALQRFQQRKSNWRTCRLLRCNAEEICDGFKLRPPGDV
jgi:hypothetical protein